MYQIIYVSDKTKEFEASDVAFILSNARKNNEKHGVTGLLVELPQHFIQIIEGRKENVERLFDHISTDARHHNLRVILAEKTRAREFSAWEMGFSTDLDESEISDALHILSAFSEKQNFNTIHGHSLKLLLKSLSSE